MHNQPRLIQTYRIIFVLSLFTTCLLDAASLHAESLPTEAWVDKWNGPAGSTDYGTLAVTDPAGPMYTAGTTYESGIDGDRDDYFIKRVNTDGSVAWYRQFGGSLNDVPSDLIVPASGLVAMTGYSADSTGVHISTFVYDDQGTLIWDHHFPVDANPSGHYFPALAADSAGNLFVSGQLNADYLLLKYSSDGTLLWQQTYEGPFDNDAAADVAVDANGDAYLTGVSINTQQFETAYATIKIDGNGVFQWEQFESGEIGSVFEFVALEVAPDGDVVVVGNPESTCGVFRVLTWKLDQATGASLWTKGFPDEPCDSVVVMDLTLDSSGNVLVTGGGSLFPGSFHYQTLKYNPSGILLWHREFDGVGTSGDTPAAITTDAADNVYVTGNTTFPPQNRDFSTVKYTPQGAVAWSMSWANDFGGNDGAYDIAVAANGDVIVIGHAWNGFTTFEDAVTILYDQEDNLSATRLPPESGLALRALLNPFTERTALSFRLGQTGHVSLKVYDIRGHLVRTLRDETVSAGDHQAEWRGRNDQGRNLPSGTYIIHLDTAQGMASSRVGLVR